MTDDADWVRISEPTCIRTVPSRAVPEGARVINEPAVDQQGRPLPTKPRTPKGTQPATKEK